MDTSLRFFEYVMQHPGMASYFVPKKKYNVKRVFQFKCVVLAAFEKHLSQTVVGNDKLELNAKMPPRKLLPPMFNDDDVKLIKEQVANPDVHYMIFPCLWEESAPFRKQCEKKQRRSHMVLLAANKARGIVEIWDDQFAKTQVLMNYEHTQSEPLDFLRPFLGTFDIEVKNIVIPSLPSEKYDYIKSIIQERTFHAVYSSFIANYLRRCVEEKKKTQTASLKAKTVLKIAKTVPPRMKNRVNKYLECYDNLKRHNDLFPHFQANVASYHNSNFPLPKPCPENQYFNIETNECEGLPMEVTIPVGEYDGSRARTENVLAYYYYICLYLLEKHPNVAMMMPSHKTNPHDYYYAMRFVYNPKKGGRNRFDLSIPPQWDRFMKKALATESVRFIPILVGIVGRLEMKHVNVIILDKAHNTIEHYEPNAGNNVEERWGNGEELAESLRQFFENDDRWTSGKFKYISGKDTCPRGLHRYEWHERAKNILDAGGNCAMWTLYMADLRLSNPEIPSAILGQYAAQEISKTGSFKHFIDSYSDHIVRIGKMSRKQEIKRKKEESAN